MLWGTHGPVELASELLPIIYVDVVKDVLVHHVSLWEGGKDKRFSLKHVPSLVKVSLLNHCISEKLYENCVIRKLKSLFISD